MFSRTIRLAQSSSRKAGFGQLRNASTAHSLLLIEHTGGEIDPSSLSALTAASAVGGEVTGLVFGAADDVAGVVEKAKTYG